MSDTAVVEKKPIDRLKAALNVESVQEQFQNALGENKNLFVASLIDLFGNDSGLQKCHPADVIKEALKAATLKLPINKSLGFAYVVAYKNSPQFLAGYKGINQLAQRTGQYKYINDGAVYEGELRAIDKLTGSIDLNGTKTSDTVIGYFAYFETVTGFKKAAYWTMDQIMNHAKRYSASMKSAISAIQHYCKDAPMNTRDEIRAAFDKATELYWKDKSAKKPYMPKSVIWIDEFDAMARKTALKNLISKYGPMSVELADVLANDDTDEADRYANSEPFDFTDDDNVVDTTFEEAEQESEDDTPPTPGWMNQGQEAAK